MYAVPRPGRGASVELWDGRWWSCAGFFAARPVFRFRSAPNGLAPVRQLAAEGLQPGGQDVTAWLAWGRSRRPRWAYLYRVDLAKRKRVPSTAQLEALSKARAVRQAQRECSGSHEFGEWLACGCGQGIAHHQDDFFADELCAFEFRLCRWCPACDERHVSDSPAAIGRDEFDGGVR
jgi:hypothetical protein